MKPNERTEKMDTNMNNTNHVSRAGRKRKPRVFSDGTTAVESPRHSSAEDDLSPIAVGDKKRLDSSNDNDRYHNKTNNNNNNNNVHNNQQDSNDGSRASNGTASGSGRKRRPRSTGGGIFKQAAIKVLGEEGRLMTTGDITKVALKRGYISCRGKTPDATMASALYSEIKRRAADTVFIRPKEGLFGLKEWSTAKEEGNGSGNERIAPLRYGDPALAGPAVVPAPPQPQPSRLGLHAPADTTTSRCFAHPHPRDGLIDLLSAAERVCGDDVKVQRPIPPPHRRKVLVASNVNAKNDKNQLPMPTNNDVNEASEKGSIGGYDGCKTNSAEHNNAVGKCMGQGADMDDVQSPKTRVLQTLQGGFDGGDADADDEDDEYEDDLDVQNERDVMEEGENDEDVRVREDDVVASWQAIRECIAACPDHATRHRALEAVEDMEQRTLAMIRRP